MSVEQTGEQLTPKPNPTLCEAVEMVRDRFNSQTTYLDVDETVAYTSFAAAYDTIEGLQAEGVNIPEFTGRIVQQTSFTPDRVDWEFILDYHGTGYQIGTENWASLMLKIAINIVERELLTKYPEVTTEARRRESDVWNSKTLIPKSPKQI